MDILRKPCDVDIAQRTHMSSVHLEYASRLVNGIAMEQPTVPKTKKEAYQRLRALAHAGSTIQVGEPHTFGPRNRLLSFVAIAPGGKPQEINHLVSRIWDMPFLDIPGQPNKQALHAWDTGNEAGLAIVGQISLKMYQRHTAYHYAPALKDDQAETVGSGQESDQPGEYT
jgi:hypothetical protein